MYAGSRTITYGSNTNSHRHDKRRNSFGCASLKIFLYLEHLCMCGAYIPTTDSNSRKMHRVSMIKRLTSVIDLIRELEGLVVAGE